MWPLVLVLCACSPRQASRRQGPTESAPDDTAADDTAAPVDFNLCGAPDGERATSDWDDPVRVALPFVDQADTTAAPASRASVYDCAPDLGEAGGEVVYRLALAEGSWLRAEVDEASGVDVDLHLLLAPSVDDDGAVTGCLERANTVLDADGLAAGDYWLVVDTYTEADGSASPGAYTLGVEGGVPGEWWEVAVAPGLAWRHLRDPDGEWGNQSIDVIAVDPRQRDIRPTVHGGGRTVTDVAAENGALAAINAGFFDGDYTSLDFVRDDGTTYATNAVASRQRTLVWDDGEAPDLVWLAAGEDHTAHANGLGSYPSVVAGGVVTLDPDPASSFSTSAHPRTAVGIAADGTWLLVTVDGRSANGDGLPLADLGALLLDLGATEAVNLDGGGSTTAVVQGCSVTGAVNHPSDGGGLDHDGARRVSDGVYVF